MLLNSGEHLPLRAPAEGLQQSLEHRHAWEHHQPSAQQLFGAQGHFHQRQPFQRPLFGPGRQLPLHRGIETPVAQITANPVGVFSFRSRPRRTGRKEDRRKLQLRAQVVHDASGHGFAAFQQSAVVSQLRSR